MAIRDWIGVATIATVGARNMGGVAKVATVSVATSPNTANPLLDQNLPHCAWRLTYVDGSTQEQFTLPEATHAEILKLGPEVIAT